MKKIWPGSGTSPYKDQNLWDNEWRQHGSCIYVKDDQLKYFESAIKIYDTLYPQMKIIDKECTAKLTKGDWTQCSLILSADKTKYTGVRKAS